MISFELTNLNLFLKQTECLMRNFFVLEIELYRLCYNVQERRWPKLRLGGSLVDFFCEDGLVFWTWPKLRLGDLQDFFNKDGLVFWTWRKLRLGENLRTD